MPTDQGVSCFDAIAGRLSRDEKEQFLHSLGRCPSGWTSANSWPGSNATEAKIGGRTSSGAAMAVVRRSGLAGLGVAPPLRSPLLTVQVYELDSDGDSIVERSIGLQHWYDASTASDFHDRRVAELRDSIRNAAELWRSKSEIFSCIRFLRLCEDQLSALDPVAFKQVLDRLVELNASALSWPPGSQSPSWRSKITPEYESREKFCYFPDDAGSVHLYELHARFTPGAGRIHFRLLHQERKIEIAYIGAKLVLRDSVLFT